MGQQRPLGAQISHMLKARGVDVIFGIPGVHNQELYRGIEEAGITHVLARHEQGAAFMADGYARATGRPGVCYVITGPGVLNALTPLGQAYSDSVPVLMVASCLDETAANRGQLHQMRDQQGAATTVTDWSETAHTAEAAFGLIERALVEFQTRRARPKAIHVPIAALQADAPEAPAAPADAPELPAGSDVDTGAVARDLLAAQKPLIIAGGGLYPHMDRWPTDGLHKVAEATGAALMTTYAGRPAFDAKAPLHFGPILSHPGTEALIGEADYVLVLGSELAEVDLWRAELGNSVPIVRVDLDPAMLTHGPATSARYLADAQGFIEGVYCALLQMEVPDQGSSDWTPAQVAAARARVHQDVAADRPGLTEVIRAIEAAVPDHVKIYSDMTQLAYAAKDIWQKGSVSWHHPYGFGTLGYALPAAIGGAIGRPDFPTLCIIGDYGLQYTLPELGTAVELGLPLPIILWDNGKLGEIEDSMIRAQIAPNAVIQQNPDFLALAKAYGADAIEPAALADIAPALDAAYKASRPTVIRLTPDLFT